jgi:hypothetical protein
MKRYETGTPRGLIAFVAIVLTAATLAVSVIAPAGMNYDTREIGVLAGSGDEDQAHRAVDVTTSTIDVVAVRGVRLVPVAAARSTTAKPGLQG